MPGWLAEALKLLGFTTPFVYAAATYGIFHLLDNNATDAARRALAIRLQSARAQNAAKTNFVTETFDLVYTRPLLHWRALLRCFGITAVISVIVWFETGLLISKEKLPYPWIVVLCIYLIVFFTAHYLSLFVIRPWLVAARRLPVLSLVVAAIIGMAIVCLSNLVSDFVLTLMMGGSKGSLTIWFLAVMRFSQQPFSTAEPLANLLLWGFGIHLWFVVFALAVTTAQIPILLSGIAGRMHRLVKFSEQHPFRVVGYPAALIVFVLAAALQLTAK